jgi:hypothetical protein
MSVLKVKKNGEWENVSGTSGHTHTKGDIIDFPSSLPANGGNADTLDGKHAEELASAVDVNNLKGLVGDSKVSEQISAAIKSKADSGHIHEDINESIDNLNVLVGDTSVSDQISAAIGKITHPIPSVSTSDNGKFMRVVSGSWAAVSLPNAEGASF